MERPSPLRRTFPWLLIASVPTLAAAGTPVELLRGNGDSAASSKPALASTGQLDAAALEADSVSFRLPDGRRFIAQRRYVERDANGSTWSGDLEGTTDGHLRLTRFRSVVTGVVDVGGDTFELTPASTGGRHKLTSVNLMDGGFEPPAHDAPRLKTSLRDLLPGGGVGHLPADAAPVVQDVLVLYTSASASKRGAATLESMIAGGIASANEAYRNSDVGITLRLVGVQRSSTAVESSSGMIDTLAALRASPEARSLREQFRADMVLLVNENRDWCGYAYIMFAPGTDYAESAYGAVQSGCISNDMIAHELGHIQGLMHDRTTTADDGALPYGHGYRICEPEGFRDVMSYACDGLKVTRLRQFSNPSKIFRGRPTGVAYETDPRGSADAARALNETAALVATYRDAREDVPLPPSGLQARILGGDAVLNWRDASSDESAFVIERRRHGAFRPIARVPANVVSFVDGTVRPGRIYQYRVSAENGAGRSAGSVVVTVTIGRSAVSPNPVPTPSLAAWRRFDSRGSRDGDVRR